MSTIKKRKPACPSTPGEWQDAVDLAEFFTHLESARQYGLVTGGPEINLDRCRQLLNDGLRRGVRPRPGCVERIAATWPGTPDT